MNIPRPEYPRPEFVRASWQNLNGEWAFEIDNGKSGRERELYKDYKKLSAKIIVPFCPESTLSGIGNTEFMECVWYSRSFNIPKEWKGDKRITLLHIGACDYRTQIWINGKNAGVHHGGYSPFSIDITDFIEQGENIIYVCAEDDLRSNKQPAGKQSRKYFSQGCSYTRTTGIWQTVWLENLPDTYIENTKYTPDISTATLYITAKCKNSNGKRLSATAYYQGNKMGIAEGIVSGGIARLTLKLSELWLWAPGTPNLYDLELVLGDDRVSSYFGMRSIAYENGKILINNTPVFQRLVLDQGFYPEGIYTAPSDEALQADIIRSLDMGFNGARLHQKVFEPRFLYHCDKLGYIVWGEHASWGLDISVPEAWRGFIPEWLEILKRDYNHPAIVGWCPLNETQNNQDPEFLRALANITRAFDDTRLYIDASGWVHVEGLSDILDTHDYEQDPAVFKAKYDLLAEGKDIALNEHNILAKPTFISEYGGIWWSDKDSSGWGYGTRPATIEEYISRYKQLTETLLCNPKICAFCYTQLTDVEQEVNGLYTYDRRPKADPAIFYAINTRKAAIER
ncbi:MAG: beta-galactosidase [Lentisphaerae bacterium]|nr:beta-galactosidase [Lentisphaerota bacterium]